MSRLPAFDRHEFEAMRLRANCRDLLEETAALKAGSVRDDRCQRQTTGAREIIAKALTVCDSSNWSL